MLRRVIHTLFFCGFFPRRCALNARSLSLPAAYLGHWLALTLAVAAYLATAAALDPRGEFAENLAWLNEWSQPQNVLLLFVLLAILEIAFLLLALLLLPWTDPQARVRAVSCHALRTVWLHTGHLGLAAFPLAVVVSWLNPLPYSAELELYQQYLLPAAFGGGVIWYLWGAIRAVTLPLDQPETREPLCEHCGYNLSYHQDADARCPECGQSALWSLSQDRRQPLRWRANSKRLRHRLRWFRVTRDAWYQPARLFSDLSTLTGLGAAGLFLCTQLFLAGEAIALAILIGVGLIAGGRVPSGFLDFFYFLNLFGGFCCLVIGAFICLVAALVGLLISRQIGRNCTGGVIRVACYCSGIFAPWLFLQIIILFATIEIMQQLHLPYWYRSTALEMGFLALVACLAVIYTAAVARRTSYLRYANR